MEAVDVAVVVVVVKVDVVARLQRSLSQKQSLPRL